MAARKTALFLLCAIASISEVQAEEKGVIKFGDSVMVELTGEQAKKYASTVLGREMQSDASFFVPCMVVRAPKHGKVSLEHMLMVESPFRTVMVDVDEDSVD